MLAEFKSIVFLVRHGARLPIPVTPVFRRKALERLPPPILASLEGRAAAEDLTPRSIQSYFTGKFAEHFGLKLTHDQAAVDKLDLILAIPAEKEATQPVEEMPKISSVS